MVDGAEVFFRGHLDARRRSPRRDLGLFAQLVETLGLTDWLDRTPVLAILGSKGKGTAAAAATFHLVTGGHRVVTVTSPHYISARERIRIDGRPFDETEFDRVAVALEHALEVVPIESASGYLSPVGRFLAMGLWFAHQIDADAVVIEAGMGGMSDEVSRCRPDVLAVTQIFAEHLGLIGNDLREIAVEKLSVATVPGVSQVVSLPQSPVVTEVANELQVARSGGVPTWTTLDTADTADTADTPDDSLAIRGRNTLLGLHAAQLLLPADRTSPAPLPIDRSRVDDAVAAITLPGRMQRIAMPAAGASRTQLVVDSAATPVGVSAALHQLGAEGWIPELIVCGIPADRDPEAIESAINAASGPVPTVFCSFPSDKFTFAETAVTLGRAVTLASGQKRVLVTGVVSFVGLFLTECGVAPQPWW